MGFVGRWKRGTTPGNMIHTSTSTAKTAEPVMTLQSLLTDPVWQHQCDAELYIFFTALVYKCQISPSLRSADHDGSGCENNEHFLFDLIIFFQTQILNTCFKYLHWPIMTRIQSFGACICLNNSDPISLQCPDYKEPLLLLPLVCIVRLLT